MDTQALALAQRVPSLGIPSRMRGVVELYDAATDWIPIYDKSALPGFYMACGTSGNQYKNAPVAGRLMAALIDYCEGGTDHDVTPMRLRLGHIGHEIDASFFLAQARDQRRVEFLRPWMIPGMRAADRQAPTASDP